jgi:hypothetical protein
VRETAGTGPNGLLILGCVPLLLALSPPSFMQAATQKQPAQDPASQPSTTEEPAALPLTAQPDTPPPSAPQPPAPPMQAADDGLEVPATLAPLAVDTSEPTPAVAPPLPAQVHFGGRGQWVLMGSSNGLGISNQTYDNSSASYFYIDGEIGIDHFVARNVSIGFDVEASYRDNKSYGATTFYGTKSTSFEGGIRFGVNVPLSEVFSWYPRLTLMIGSSHSTITPISSYDGSPPGDPVSQSSVGPAFNLYAPLLLHPTPHFVLGFGPQLGHDFAVRRGGPYDGSQRTWISGYFTVGGWWGGASTDSAAPAEIANREKPATESFGKAGQFVLTTATDASLGYSSYSHSKGSQTDVTIAPSVDYFFTNNVSMGIDLPISNSSGTGLDPAGATTRFSSSSFGIAARLGANLPLLAELSIWLTGDIGHGTVHSSISSANGTNEHSRTRSWIDVSAPLLVHPASHFFVGFGPFVFHELSNQDQNNIDNKGTQLGARLVLGGWFDEPHPG